MTKWCTYPHGDRYKHRITRVGCLACLAANQTRVLVPYEEWAVKRNEREKRIQYQKQNRWVKWWLGIPDGGPDETR